MGLLDWLSSTKHPDAGVPVCTAADLRERILTLNRDSAPFRIVDGRGEGVDLIAEGKIVDAQWYEIFAKAGLKKVFEIRLKLDDGAREVRAKDYEYDVSWSAGVPSLHLASSRFRGQKQSVQFGTAYAFTEELRPGQVYNYRFSTGEMKEPIQEAVTSCGWTYKGITFGKL